MKEDATLTKGTFVVLFCFVLFFNKLVVIVFTLWLFFRPPPPFFFSFTAK